MAKKSKKAADVLEFLAVHSTLPAEAQEDGYDGEAKSYTLTDPQHRDGAARISVLIEKQFYYVCPVEEFLGPDAVVYKINRQEWIDLNS